MLDPHETRRRATGTYPPPPRLALAVRDLIATIGEVAATRQLGVSRSTALRLAMRMPVRRGSTALAAAALGLGLDEAAP